VDQPKPTADDSTVLKEGIDFMRMGIGGDIEIFWDLSEQKISNASPNEIS
jgi:capsid portal protein